MSYRYTLDPSSNKFICPACGKKRFVKYWDVEESIYLNEGVGSCDRKIECAYHFKPRDYFQANKLNVSLYTSKDYTPPKPPPKAILHLQLISSYSNNFESNNFIQFLYSIFRKPVVKKIIIDYRLCSISKPWNGSVIFWAIDQHHRLCYGKIMDYNKASGRRIKKPYVRTTSFHRVYCKGFKGTINYQKCLFGLHLANEDLLKPIAVVESEKTACIMSAVDNNFIWMACGSIGNVNSEMFLPIKNRKIRLYPDLSNKNENDETAYDIWLKKSRKLETKGFDIKVSEFLYKLSNSVEKTNGYDIADFYIEQLKKTPYVHQKRTIKPMLTSREKNVEWLINKNPVVKNLIQTFDLY